MAGGFYVRLTIRPKRLFLLWLWSRLPVRPMWLFRLAADVRMESV